MVQSVVIYNCQEERWKQSLLRDFLSRKALKPLKENSRKTFKNLLTTTVKCAIIKTR